MTWEIALIVGQLGTAFIFLMLAFYNRDDQERFMPLKLIFIALALLLCLMSFRTSALIIGANNATINDSAMVGNLTSIADTGYQMMNWVFYLFVVATVLTLLIVVVKWLKNRKKR